MKAQTFQVVRIGDRLCPADAAAMAAVHRLPFEKRITIKLQSDRSHEQLAMYWSVLERVVEATGRWHTPEELHLALKVACGYVDKVRLLNGRLVLCPGSIAFDKMGQEEAQRYYDAALKIVAEEIMDCPIEDLLAA